MLGLWHSAQWLRGPTYDKTAKAVQGNINFGTFNLSLLIVLEINTDCNFNRITKCL